MLRPINCRAKRLTVDFSSLVPPAPGLFSIKRKKNFFKFINFYDKNLNK